jgi:hypothetical protein
MHDSGARPTRHRPSARLERGATFFAGLVAIWLVLSTVAAPPAVAQPAPATTEPSRAGGGMFVRTEHLSAPAAAYHRARLDLGIRFRPLDHLAIDVGIGVGGGRMRRPDGPDRLTEVGLVLDVIGYLNPRSVAQVFVVGGVGFGASGSTEQVGTVDPECPSDSMFFADLSIGAGLEIAFNDTLSLVGATRAVHRTALTGELEFLSDDRNPPNRAMRNVWAVSAEVRLIVALRPTPQ